MKKALIYLVVILLLSSNTFSQCEVKSFSVPDKYTRYTMTEKFYQNGDLENGILSVFVHVNSFKESNTQSIFYRSLVVTYVYSSPQPSFTPGKLIITLSNGDNITLLAVRKSTGTINETVRTPYARSIEGVFDLAGLDVTKIIGGSISSFYIIDIRENLQFDITPKYKGILSEMLNCVNN